MVICLSSFCFTNLFISIKFDCKRHSRREVVAMMAFFSLTFFLIVGNANAVANGKLKEVLAWNQIGYNFDGVRYEKDSIYDRDPTFFHFPDDVEENDRFFIQYNNVPVGFEVYNEKVFVTVPKRRYGIPSTLNVVDISSSKTAPLLRPYPDIPTSRELVSVYRPRVDACDRLWMVDTGLLEVPDDRKQLKPPAIVIFDLKTNKQILRYSLKDSDLVNNRTSGGLTSITVEVSPSSCDDAFAYITDLATAGIIVYSLKNNDSWRIDHASFAHDPAQVNFTAGGYTIPWRDGVFSLALAEDDGKHIAYYHPLASAEEFSIDTDELKNKGDFNVKKEGTRSTAPQCGSHAYHPETEVILYAGVARDGLLCWNIKTPHTDEYVNTVAEDHEKLLYISDLKIVGDEVWVLVNKMPVFVYSAFDKMTPNFFIHKAKVEDLIQGTPCDTSLDERIKQ